MDNKSLDQLSRAFSVRDIMTSARLLKRADSHEDAKPLFEEYDVIPHPLKGRIHGFFKRDCDKLHSIDRTNIVSDGTSLFDFARLLQKNEFYFVLSANLIIGYAHYSDLNKPLVKIPFFALSQGVERKLWERIDGKISDILIENVFPDEKDRIFRRKRIAERNNIDLPWIGVFTFPHILKIAQFLGIVSLSADAITELKTLRNKFAHSDRPLIHDKKDVKRLVISHTLLSSIMNGLLK